MGFDAPCKASLGGQSAAGTAQLETDFIQFRATQFRFKVLLKNLTEVEAVGDFLNLKFEGRTAALQLGEKAAAKWAGKILNPPTRADKLGVKPGATVFLEGELDPAFQQEVKGQLGPLANAHSIFLAASDKRTLLKTPELVRKMSPAAALWIVYPKGQTTIREADVIAAGRAAGLKDVKVVRFSDSDTALKFVVPVARR